jgi:hypothetical protein
MLHETPAKEVSRETGHNPRDARAGPGGEAKRMVAVAQGRRDGPEPIDDRCMEGGYPAAASERDDAGASTGRQSQFVGMGAGVGRVHPQAARGRRVEGDDKVACFGTITWNPGNAWALPRPLRASDLRRDHEAIRPGYHLDKRDWITVMIGAEAPRTIALELVEGSYELVA